MCQVRYIATGRKCFTYKGESKISERLNSHKPFSEGVHLQSGYRRMDNTLRGLEENNGHHQVQLEQDFC